MDWSGGESMSGQQRCNRAYFPITLAVPRRNSSRNIEDLALQGLVDGDEPRVPVINVCGSI